MIVKTAYRATCSGCKQVFSLFEYKGLEGGLYGCHHCWEINDFFDKDPDGDRFHNLHEDREYDKRSRD